MDANPLHGNSLLVVNNLDSNGDLTWSDGLPLVPEPWQDYNWRDFRCTSTMPFRFICESEGI